MLPSRRKEYHGYAHQFCNGYELLIYLRLCGVAGDDASLIGENDDEELILVESSQLLYRLLIVERLPVKLVPGKGLSALRPDQRPIHIEACNL